MIKVCRRGAADDVTLQCFERCSQWDTFTKTVKKRIVLAALFIQPVDGFVKEHVNASIDKWRLTQLYAEAGNVQKKGLQLTPSRSSSDATGKFKNMPKRESFRNKKSKKVNRLKWGPSLRKVTMSKPGSSRSRSSRRRDQNSHWSDRTRNPSFSVVFCSPKLFSLAWKGKIWERFRVIVSPAKKNYEHALEYRTQCLDKPSEYGGTVAENIAKLTKRLQRQKRSHMFDGFDSISVLYFLFFFRLMFSSNGINDGVPTWSFQLFIRSSFSAAVNVRLFFYPTSLSNMHRAKNGMLRTNLEVVIYIFQSSHTDDVFAETDTVLTRYT